MKLGLRLPLDDIREGERVLDEGAARYLIKVHRAAVGAAVLVFDPLTRLEADARIVSLAKRRAVLELGPVRAATRVPNRPLVLLQGLPKGSKLDAIMRDATELGATHLVATATMRSQPRTLSPAHRARCLRVASEAARQSGRGDVPELSAHDSLAAAISAMAERFPAAARLALDPHATAAMTPLPNDAAVIVAIGPEGGFSDSERAALETAGFALVQLGAFVMRTETAPAAALGAVAALRFLP